MSNALYHDKFSQGYRFDPRGIFNHFKGSVMLTGHAKARGHAFVCENFKIVMQEGCLLTRVEQTAAAASASGKRSSSFLLRFRLMSMGPEKIKVSSAADHGRLFIVSFLRRSDRRAAGEFRSVGRRKTISVFLKMRLLPSLPGS